MAFTYGPTLIPWYEPAPTSSIFIAPRVDGLSGSGTALDPFDASTQAKYDALVLGFPSGAVIYYATGVYLTNGSGPGKAQNALPHRYHVGAGIDQTIVRLSPSAPASTNGQLRTVLFFADYNQRCDGFQVWNMTIDCNADNNTAYLGSAGANIMAVNGVGNNTLIYGCKVIGFGTSTVGNECFVINLSPIDAGFTNLTWTHCHIENCLFTLPGTHNKDGESTCCLNPESGHTGIDFLVLNNTFTNISSNFLYSHALTCINGQGNIINGCSDGCYLEPDAPSDNNQINLIAFSFNTFSNCGTPCQITMHASGVTTPILFAHNNVTTVPGTLHGVCINGEIATTIPAIPSITVSNNLFPGNPVNGQNVQLVSNAAGTIGTAYINDNVSALDDGNENLVDSTVSNVQFCRNTKTGGTAMTLTGYSGTIIPCAIVTPPSTPVVTVGLVTDTTVIVSWPSSTDIASGALGNSAAQLSYVVQRKTGAGGTYANVYYPFGDSPTCTWMDRTVVSGTTYFYQVAAMDNRGNQGSFSTPVSATTTGGTTPPTTPTGLTATVIGTSQINLGWTQSTDTGSGQLGNAQALITYVITRSIGQGNNTFSTIATTAGGASAYNDTGLSPATVYNYQIESKDTGGNVSSPTSTVTGSTMIRAPCQPLSPSKLSLIPRTNLISVAPQFIQRAINHVTGTNTCPVTTSSTGSGNLLGVYIGTLASGSSIASVTDNKGNVYSPVFSDTAFNASLFCYNCTNSISGATVMTVVSGSGGATWDSGSAAWNDTSVTWDSSAGELDVVFYEFSAGPGSSWSFDANSIDGSTSGGSTTINSGTTTVTKQSNEVVIAAAEANGTTITAGTSGWTGAVSGTNGWSEYEIVSSSGSYAASFTVGSTGHAWTAGVGAWIALGSDVRINPVAASGSSAVAIAEQISINSDAFVQQSENSVANSGAISCGVSLSATHSGNLIVVYIGTLSAGSVITSVTDNKANTYSLAFSDTAFNSSLLCYHCLGCIAGVTTVTVLSSATINSNQLDVAVYEISGVGNWAFDKFSVSGSNSGSTTAATSGATVATTVSNEVIIGACFTNGTTVTAGTAGWTGQSA